MTGLNKFRFGKSTEAIPKCWSWEVAKEDVGNIIGRQGRTAQAIRTILGAASAKSNTKTVLYIIE